MSEYKSDQSRSRARAFAAFTAKRVELKIMLGRLLEHGFHVDGTVDWGHVGDLSHYAELLRQITDSVFHEGEHAPQPAARPTPAPVVLFAADLTDEESKAFRASLAQPKLSGLTAPVPSVWSGSRRYVPAIGERIHVFMNGLGFAKVIAYFVEEGFLGVEVKLEKSPKWRTDQLKRAGYRDTVSSTVFGAEVETVAHYEERMRARRAAGEVA